MTEKPPAAISAVVGFLSMPSDQGSQKAERWRYGHPECRVISGEHLVNGKFGKGGLILAHDTLAGKVGIGSFEADTARRM